MPEVINNATCACGAKGKIIKDIQISNGKVKAHASIANGCQARNVHITMFGTHCMADGKRV